MHKLLITSLLAGSTVGVLANDHFGTVPLRAEVKASTRIQVTPTALASNLDIDGDASSGPIATVTAWSNSEYTVTLYSDNMSAVLQAAANAGTAGGDNTAKQFFLRQSGTSAEAAATELGERINYQLTFGGAAVIAPVATAAAGTTADGVDIISAGAPTGNAGFTSSLNIVIEGNQAYSAGVYTDLLTLVISPDTSF